MHVATLATVALPVASLASELSVFSVSHFLLPNSSATLSLELLNKCVHFCEIVYCVCVCVPLEARDGIRSLGTGVPGSGELHDVDSENQTSVLGKRSKCS